jgi:hypothetical protein
VVVQVVDVKNRDAVGKPRCFAQRCQAVLYGLGCGSVPLGYELALWKQGGARGGVGATLRLRLLPRLLAGPGAVPRRA